MMACYLARELRMKEVVVPATPGVLSALGGLIADVKNDFLSTVYADGTQDAMPRIRQEFQTLEKSAIEWLRNGQGYHGDYVLTYSAEMRYRGQSFEIDTPLDAAAIERGDHKAILDAFHHEHARLYGHADPDAAIQIISVRLIITGKTVKPEFPHLDLEVVEASAKGTAPVWMDGAIRQAAYYWRSDLKPGHYFDGPAIIGQEDCTTVVLPGYSVKVDEVGNLRIIEGVQA